MQSLLILVAPALFAASIYIILGRVILLVDGERYSLVRLKWLTKTFVLGDVFSFLLQGSGKSIIEMVVLDKADCCNRRWHSSCRFNQRPSPRRENHHHRLICPAPLLRPLHRRCRHIPPSPRRRPRCQKAIWQLPLQKVR